MAVTAQVFIHLIAGGATAHISREVIMTHCLVPFLYEKSFLIRSFGAIQLTKPKKKKKWVLVREGTYKIM